MKDMTLIMEGFNILRHYGEEDASMNYERTLFAGPEDLDLDEYNPDDRQRLENACWHFDENIQRWGYRM